MAFPPGFLDELRARLSLSDVVGRKVSLKRRSGSGIRGTLSVPQREDAVLHGQRQEGLLLLLRLPRERRRGGLHDEDRGPLLPRVGRKARPRGRHGSAARHAAVDRERAERASTLQDVVEQAARWFQKQLRLPVGRQGLRKGLFFFKGQWLVAQVQSSFGAARNLSMLTGPTSCISASTPLQWRSMSQPAS